MMRQVITLSGEPPSSWLRTVRRLLHGAVHGRDRRTMSCGSNPDHQEVIGMVSLSCPYTEGLRLARSSARKELKRWSNL